LYPLTRTRSFFVYLYSYNTIYNVKLQVKRKVQLINNKRVPSKCDLNRTVILFRRPFERHRVRFRSVKHAKDNKYSVLRTHVSVGFWETAHGQHTATTRTGEFL